MQPKSIEEKNKPSLSIITPSYNQGRFLEKTIRSVLDQNYPALEYVIVDGGSNDQSVEIIRKYKNRLAGWVSEKDQGQADALNKGAQMGNGEIMAWINSDDFYLTGAFDEASAFLESHPEIDLVFGDVIAVDKTGNLINVMRFDHWGLDDLMAFHIISQPAVFFRRSAWEAAGGMDLAYHYLLDHHLWLRIAARGRIAYCPRPWACARYHEEAKNLAHAAEFCDEARKISHWMERDPLFKEKYAAIKKKIHGGACCFSAYYFSEGGKPWQALSAYVRAFPNDPRRVFSDKRRIALTLIMAFSPKLAKRVYQRKSAERKKIFREYEKYLV